MLSTSELLSLIRDEIAANVALSTWCVNKYAKRPTVYIGVDVENPPDVTDYPIIVIEDITEARGNTQHIQSWVVSIGVGIVDDSQTTTTVTVPGATPSDDPIPVSTVKTFAGLADVETFREKVENILKAARFAKITFTTETTPLSLYPEFNSFTFATIEQIYTRRRS